MKKRHGFIGFIKESVALTSLSNKINLLDKQLTEQYLQLGLLTYNISAGISNDINSIEILKSKITYLKQNIADLTKTVEERGLSRNKSINFSSK